MEADSKKSDKKKKEASMDAGSRKSDQKKEKISIVDMLLGQYVREFIAAILVVYALYFLNQGGHADGVTERVLTYIGILITFIVMMNNKNKLNRKNAK